MSFLEAAERARGKCLRLLHDLLLCRRYQLNPLFYLSDLPLFPTIPKSLALHLLVLRPTSD
jgi:hypothetical protein